MGSDSSESLPPEQGTANARLSRIESFLTDHSSTVKTELARMQGEIDGLRPTSQATPSPAWALATDPETCPTAAEQTYIRDLTTHVDSMVDGFQSLPLDKLGTILTDDSTATYDLEADALRMAAQNIRDLTPPNTRRALMVHDTALRMVEETLGVVDALEHAIEVRNPILLLRAMADVFSPMFETVIVVFAVSEFCDLSSIWPPEIQLPSASTPAPPEPATTATPTPTDATAHPLVDEFGCPWIMDTYRPMAVAGRDLAIQHVASSMSLKRSQDGRGFSLVLIVDAGEALRECEAQGFT